MKVSQIAIASFAKFVVGGKLFANVKDLVLQVESRNIDGVTKKRNVVASLQTLGYDVGTWIVNLAIELAVAYFKTLTTK